MSHAHAANFVHCVFSTKERRNQIPIESQEKLYAYLIGIADKLGFTILAAGGTANHVHLLIGLPPSFSPSLVATVQACIRNQEEHYRKRSFEEEFVVMLRKSGVVYDPDRLFAA